MKRVISIALALSVIALALFATATQLPHSRPAAQSAAQKQLYNLTIMHVKPERLADYTSFLKNEMNPLYIKGGAKARYVWWPDRGQRSDLIFFAPMDNYATMNQPGQDPINKALGGAEAAALFYQKQRQFLDGQEQLTVEALPDISWTNPKQQGQPQFALMRWRTVAQGRGGDYEAFLKAYNKSASQTEMLGQWRYHLRFGGDPSRYLTLRPLASYAELDAGDPLVKKFGEAEARKLFSQLAPEVTVKEEVYLIRFRPDLSIVDGKIAQP